MAEHASATTNNPSCLYLFSTLHTITFGSLPVSCSGPNTNSQPQACNSKGAGEYLSWHVLQKVTLLELARTEQHRAPTLPDRLEQVQLELQR
jgi:hypothetical protein